MGRPIIAVDLDDTLAATAAGWIAYSNEHWGTNLTIDDYSEDWATIWQVDQATVRERSQQLHTDGSISKYAHHKAAVGVLQQLSQRYDLVIASSRNQLAHAETLAWIDTYFGGIFNNIHFTGFFDDHAPGAHLLTKADLMRDIDAEYLIDDQPKHCFAAAADGKKAVLFGDYPWNRSAELPAGVTRCKDWAAVLEYFNGQPDRT